MKDIIKAWKGWRLEFEQEYGSDMDGATEYSSHSTFDWSIDLAEIIETNMMGWMKGTIMGCDDIYLEEVSAEQLKIHFTCGYAVTLSHAIPSYGYNFTFGRGDYSNYVRLLPPWEKREEISKFKEVHCRRKCLQALKPEDVVVPDNLEAVDLGLSVDWAPFNLGATAPEQFGNYFAWSEIEPDKKGYSYIRGLKDDEGKDMYDGRGNTLYEFSGIKKYDAATVFWGKGWRVPSRDEFAELRNSCRWKYTEHKGREGYMVTGPSGKSIFLPLNKDNTRWDGRYGSTYWSSSGYMMPGGSTKGYSLKISNDKGGDRFDNYLESDFDTAMQYLIRPVKDKW